LTTRLRFAMLKVTVDEFAELKKVARQDAYGLLRGLVAIGKAEIVGEEEVE
jgi:hypothetical protein